MQSDGNSFYGDVVLDSLNKASRDEDSILDQNYEKQMIFKSRGDCRKGIFKEIQNITTSNS